MKIIYEDIQAVIFDFDGTLYDSYMMPVRLIFSSPLKSFIMWMERCVRKELKGCFFKSKEDFLCQFYKLLSRKTLNSPAHLKKWYLGKYLPAMVKLLTRYYAPNKGLPELFNKLQKNNIAFSIMSDYGMLKERIEAVGIDTSVTEHIYSTVDLGGLKPAGQLFEQVAQKMGVKPENVLVVGDRVDTDGKGAEASEMKFIRIRNKKNWLAQKTKKYPFLEWNEFLTQVID